MRCNYGALGCTGPDVLKPPPGGTVLRTRCRSCFDEYLRALARAYGGPALHLAGLEPTSPPDACNCAQALALHAELAAMKAERDQLRVRVSNLEWMRANLRARLEHAEGRPA